LQTGIETVDIRTPTGIILNNVERFDPKRVVAVSIIRAGDSMLDSFLSICTDVQVGKILIQRDEETAQPKLIYYKVPNLTGKQVILLDPMLATGGSAKSAIQVLFTALASSNV
jgi:uracil phosphoribosyltransferase